MIEIIAIWLLAQRSPEVSRFPHPDMSSAFPAPPTFTDEQKQPQPAEPPPPPSAAQPAQPPPPPPWMTK